MKTWLAIAAALLVPGGTLVLAAAWWRRRSHARAVRTIDSLIVPPIPTSGNPTTEKERETIRLAADRRRQAADDKQREAARIRSGQPAEERIRLVKS